MNPINLHVVSQKIPTLDKLGYLPVVGFFVGLGKVIAGLAKSIFGHLSHSFSLKSEGRLLLKRGWQEMTGSTSLEKDALEIANRSATRIQSAYKNYLNRTKPDWLNRFVQNQDHLTGRLNWVLLPTAKPMRRVLQFFTDTNPRSYHSSYLSTRRRTAQFDGSVIREFRIEQKGTSNQTTIAYEIPVLHQYEESEHPLVDRNAAPPPFSQEDQDSAQLELQRKINEFTSSWHDTSSQWRGRIDRELGQVNRAFFYALQQLARQLPKGASLNLKIEDTVSLFGRGVFSENLPPLVIRANAMAIKIHKKSIEIGPQSLRKFAAMNLPLPEAQIDPLQLTLPVEIDELP